MSTCRKSVWRRLLLTTAVAVVFLLYLAFHSSGTTGTTELLFGNKGKENSNFLDDRLVGLVHRNPWKRKAGNRHGQPGVIPKVVYISVASTKKVTPHFRSTVSSCTKLNPDYQVKVMGDEERTQVVAEHAPGLLAGYSKLKATERNDFWSYLMLYLFGGWYVDHDVKCVKPFDDFAANFNGYASAIVGIEAVLPKETNRSELGFCCPVQYCHWVMGSAPGHALFGHVVDLMLDFQTIAAADPDSAPGKQIDNPVMSTGPGMLTKAVEHFMALFDVYTVDVALKAPEMVADLGVMPATAVAAGGYGTEDNTPGLVYVKHMFAGTWKGGNPGSW